MPDPTVVRAPARASGAEVDLLRTSDGVTVPARDVVAVEEPLEIRLNGWRWLVTMRTPGDDADLIVGLLASEGVIAAAAEVETIVFTRHPDEPELANVADVRLGRPLGELQARLARNQTLASSSCGLCGKSAVEALLVERRRLPAGPVVAASTLAALPDRLAAAQPVFRATGGLHAAGLFDAAGALLVAREDIGRHNATDKALGWRLGSAGAAANTAVLLVSGRASFEIVQKALAAAVPIVAAVSAPSSLACSLAREAGMTLVGFVRGGSLNVYTGAERVAATDDRAADPLEFIPQLVRAALDAARVKISLVDWRALEGPERERLVALAAHPGAEFAAYLRDRVTARTGRPPRPLVASPRPS